MSIKQRMTDRIIECMKSGNSFERDTLKTVLGVVQNLEGSKGEGNVTDEDCEKIFRKFKQGVEYTIDIIQKGNTETDIVCFEKEIKIYDQYISQTMSVEEIVDFLEGTAVELDIKEAKSDGQAVGVVMKFFKGNPEFGKVQGKDVTEAVKMLRENNGK